MRAFIVSSDAYPAMTFSASKSSRSPHSGAAVLRPLALIAPVGLALLAGCAQPPQQQPRTQIQRSSTEYFPEGRYGRASPRIVADDRPVPRGGGQYLVGRPYTIAGKRYFPSETPREAQTGMASYYGGAFHGRKTANGEVFDMTSISAAHPTMPLPSYARVTNTRNGRSMIVRVNDRGPYHGGRVLDVSQRVAEALDFRHQGTAQVRVEYVGRASLGGSDDRRLMATLRTDGQPAALDGALTAGPTLIAGNLPAAPPRPEPQRLALAPEPRLIQNRAATTPVNALTASAPENTVAFAPTPGVLPERAPLPPIRPFDLGTIPGAGVPIAARPVAAALYFAPPDRPMEQFNRRGPFVRIGAAWTGDIKRPVAQ